MVSREPSDAEVDAAFHEIVSHLDGPSDLPREDPEPPLTGEVLDPEVPDDPRDTGWRVHTPPEDDELDDLDEPLPRTPLPPWRPSSVTLAALLLIGGTVVVTVLLLAGVVLPWWAGWAAVAGFLTGMGLLFSRLPRDRDEDSDDGAVV